MLKGLQKYCPGWSRPGLRRIRYAPTHLIDYAAARQVINSQGEWIFAVPFLSGTWLEAKIQPIEDAWQENMNRSEQGESYQQSISGVIKGLRGEYSRELAQMARMRFVVLLTDKNGQDWLIGSLQHGLDFSYSGDTGDSNGRNSIRINFAGLQKHPAAIYSPL